MIGEYHLKLEAQRLKTDIQGIIFFSTQKGPWKQFISADFFQALIYCHINLLHLHLIYMMRDG